MSTEQPTDEIRSSTIVSRSPGLAYERMREGRTAHFSQPLANKLTVEGALLVALAGALSLAVGLGAGAVDGSSPNLVTLAAGAGALVAAAATAHGAVGAYRLLNEPITEREALALLTVEDAASYLGIATGGILTAMAVVATLVGAVGDPVASPGSPDLAVTVAIVLAVVAGVTLAAGRHLEGRLPRSD